MIEQKNSGRLLVNVKDLWWNLWSVGVAGGARIVECPECVRRRYIAQAEKLMVGT